MSGPLLKGSGFEPVTQGTTKTAKGVPGVGEVRSDIVSPSLVKAVELGAAVALGLAVGGIKVGVAVRPGVGVRSGEVLGVNTVAVAVAGVALNSATIGAAVGGVSSGAQPVRRMAARDRDSQILAKNC